MVGVPVGVEDLRDPPPARGGGGEHRLGDRGVDHRRLAVGVDQIDVIVGQDGDLDDLHHQTPGVRHRRPWLGRLLAPAGLEQFDRDAVGRADERHMPVARRPVDRHPARLQPRAGVVDIVDGISEVAEVAPAGVLLGVPIIGQLDLRAFVAGRGEEDEREAPLLAVLPLQLLEPEQLVEGEAGVEVADPDHRVEIFHVAAPVAHRLYRPSCQA